MNSNPWQVDSIQAFNCLKCPECMFFSQEENDFKGHAIENHPMSNTLFGNFDDEQKSNMDQYDIDTPMTSKKSHMIYDSLIDPEMIKEEPSEFW